MLESRRSIGRALSRVDASTRSSRAWAWLFPATYAVHALEEYFGGFPAWFSMLTGGTMTDEWFVALNTLAFCVMTVLVFVFHLRGGRTVVVPVALATVVLVNGSAHAISSILSRSWSPGVVSGVMLWIPLGVLVWRWANVHVRLQTRVAGAIVGLMLHALVTFSALA